MTFHGRPRFTKDIDVFRFGSLGLTVDDFTSPGKIVQLYPRRFAAAMLVAGGVIGLVLSCIGLYGVVSYSVAQRLREIGIRATLGADRRDIVLRCERKCGSPA